MAAIAGVVVRAVGKLRRDQRVRDVAGHLHRGAVAGRNQGLDGQRRIVQEGTVGIDLPVAIADVPAGRVPVLGAVRDGHAQRVEALRIDADFVHPERPAAVVGSVPDHELNGVQIVRLQVQPRQVDREVLPGRRQVHRHVLDQFPTAARRHLEDPRVNVLPGRVAFGHEPHVVRQPERRDVARPIGLAVADPELKPAVGACPVPTGTQARRPLPGIRIVSVQSHGRGLQVAVSTPRPGVGVQVHHGLSQVRRVGTPMAEIDGLLQERDPWVRRQQSSILQRFNPQLAAKSLRSAPAATDTTSDGRSG